MNTNHKLTLAVLTGIVIGIAGGTAIHAQQVKTPPGYIIGDVEVTDPATYQKYAAQVPGLLAPFNGHYLVRAGKAEAIEGDAPHRVVVIAFDSFEKAKAFESSPGYEAIKGIRHSSAKSRIIVAEGVAP